MIIFLLMVGQSVPVETWGLSARHSPVRLSHILPPQLHSGGKRNDFWKKKLPNVKLTFPLPRSVKWSYVGLCMDSPSIPEDFLDWFFLQYIEKGGFCTAVRLDQIEIRDWKQNQKACAEMSCSELPSWSRAEAVRPELHHLGHCASPSREGDVLKMD